MTVDLIPSTTEEQTSIRDATVRLIESEFPLAAVRSFADGGPGPGAKYRSTAAELGWFGLLAAEAHGGGSASGNGLLDAAMLAAERGARLQPGPFTGHGIVVRTLSRAAETGRLPDTQAKTLAALIEGRSWATWLPPAVGTSAGVRVAAVASGPAPADEIVLAGDAGVVSDAGECGWFLVTAGHPDGLMQVLVPADAPGLTVRRRDGLDLTRRWYSVELDSVSVHPDAVVGPAGGQARRLLDEQLAVAAVLSAADATGAMDADFRLTVEHARSRIAFGRPVGSFQAVKHLLADTSLWLEMSKGIVSAAAEALGSGTPDGLALAHAAKSFTAERGTEVAQNCFQVLGGIGYTWEHDQHLYLRRLSAAATEFGPPEQHRQHLRDLAEAS